MSGLAIITAGTTFGLSALGAIYWLLVVMQLIMGVASYRLGLVVAGAGKK
jgi:hypothetical protein